MCALGARLSRIIDLQMKQIDRNLHTLWDWLQNLHQIAAVKVSVMGRKSRKVFCHSFPFL